MSAQLQDELRQAQRDRNTTQTQLAEENAALGDLQYQRQSLENRWGELDQMDEQGATEIDNEIQDVDREITASRRAIREMQHEIATLTADIRRLQMEIANPHRR